MAHGTPVAVERLAGMSLSGVWRVRFALGSVIVKAGPSPFEARFYERAAPALRAAGVPIPELELAHHEPDTNWLVIEDIPEALPVAQADIWQPDPRIVAILARLHATTRAEPPDLPEPPAHAWTDEMTRAALSCFPASEAADLRPRLSAVQVECRSLVTPWCWISGDPNPRNWGLRTDGSPVLFDWERFGPGSPATDLAIIVPGLGDSSAYARAATAYLAAWNDREPLPWDESTFARQIAIAKAVTVVQLLHGHVTGAAQVGADLLGWLTKAVPAWVRTIAS